VTANRTITLDKTIQDWHYLGVALPRGEEGSYDSLITGDPCIVWDEQAGRYRMVYFALGFDPLGRRVSCNGQALSASPGEVGAGAWKKIGPMKYTNPEALLGGHTHKPWLLMDPYRPNGAACVDGCYWLFTVSYMNEQKVIQVAISEFNGEFTIQWGTIFAATTVAIAIPVAILLPLQKYYIQGISSSGLKE